MADIAALAFAAILWTHPGAAPCSAADGAGCWTEEHVPAEVIAARPRMAPSEVCDGDTLVNHGWRDGRVTGPHVQVAAFDPMWLAERGIAHRVVEGRACIRSRAWGAWHDVEACGNPVKVIRRGSVLPTYAMTPLRLTEGGGTVATPRGGAHTPIVPLPRSVGLLLGALAALALVGMKRRA